MAGHITRMVCELLAKGLPFMFLGVLNVTGSTDYWGPNDDKAQDQQDIRSVQQFSSKRGISLKEGSHHFWTLLLKGELHLAPVQNPHVSVPKPQ